MTWADLFLGTAWVILVSLSAIILKSLYESLKEDWENAKKHLD